MHDYAARAGGGEVMLGQLRAGLRARGHDVRLFASSAGAAGEPLEAEYCAGTVSPFRTLLQSANPWAARALRRVLRDFRPDVVHVTMFLTRLSPLILPCLEGVPSLYYATWYRPVCRLGTRLRPDGSECRERAGAACLQGGCVPGRDWAPLTLQAHLWRRWRHRFTRVVPASEAVRRVLLENGEPVGPALPFGVPDLPARPPLTRPPVAAFAGRLAATKGVAVLLRAFRRVRDAMPEARLLIAGEGPEAAALKHLAAELGLEDCVTAFERLYEGLRGPHPPAAASEA